MAKPLLKSRPISKCGKRAGKTSGAFDILRAANTLKEAGFADAQAEALVAAMGEATGSGNLATKDDIAVLKADIAVLKADIAALEQQMQTQMKDLELRLTLRLGAIGLATAGIVVALLKLLP